MPHAELDLDRQLCFSLYRASHAVIRAYRPLLKELGLTYPQYLVMLVLWEQAPQTVNGIAERLGLDTGTVTPLLRRLEEAGLITRTWDREDERRRLIEPTSAGRSLRERAAPIPERMRGLYPLGPAQADELKAVLDEIGDALA